MSAYYNENDPYAAQWLRNLMAEGIIPAGEVDERSIREVSPGDLVGFDACHFFAGLGGWPYALRLAGVPDNWGGWTGSCPCQPFSLAGKRKAFADTRHLWPEWKRLIAARRPAIILGEQVANAPDWLALVRGDLDALAYTVGAVPIEAASAGGDHFRDRYFYVAHRDGAWKYQPQGSITHQRGRAAHGPGAGPLADGDGERSQIPLGQSSDIGPERAPVEGDRLRDMGDAAGVGWGEGWTEDELERWGITAAVSSVGDRQIIECADGKWRRLPPPRVRWLGTRIPARISKVRAFGNAIDTRPAVAFIKAALGAMDG